MSTTPPPRSLVIHHDDLGGSHAANMAFVELSEAGIVTAAPTAEDYAGLFDRAVPGLNWGGDGDLALFSEDAPLRLTEYELFESGWAKDHLVEQGIELVGMRGFRDAMRAR